MIHKLMIFNEKTAKGALLYDSTQFNLDNSLLANLIKATMMLGYEIEQIDTPLLQEMEIGKFQIALFQKEKFVYVIVQDSLDNEPFSKNILQQVVQNFHEKFRNIELTYDYPYYSNFQDLLKYFFTTMKFPKSLLPELEPLILEFVTETHHCCDVLFLSDLDDGLVHCWEDKDSTGVRKVLLEILSELDIAKSWVGEIPMFDIKTSRSKGTEIWFIFRLGITDFCILGRGYYDRLVKRDRLIYNIEELVERIHSRVLKLRNLN